MPTRQRRRIETDHRGLTRLVQDLRAVIGALALAALPAAAIPAAAQMSPRMTARADNDAFNFWTEPGARPDREYTSGVTLRYDAGDAPWWARRLVSNVAPCRVSNATCRARFIEVGQQIFTPERSSEMLAAPPGSRPNAGWLFARDGVRVLAPRVAHEFAITLGVTGPPALARHTQRFFHALAPGFNRPTDWSEQIAFEPGAMVSYVQSRRTGPASVGAVAFDAVSRAGAELGNVSTAAELGIRVRAGVNLRHPWLERDGGPVEVFVLAGAAGRGVARDLFLDGSTAGGGPRVGHEPFVHVREWAVRVRAGILTLGYGAVTQSRAYPTGPPSHTWSTVTASVSVPR